VLGRAAKAMQHHTNEEVDANEVPTQPHKNNKVLGRMVKKSMKIQMNEEPDANTQPYKNDKVLGRAAKAMKSQTQLKEMLEGMQNKKQQYSMQVGPDNVRGANVLYACTIVARPEKLSLSFKSMPIREHEAIAMEERLNEWDPFWKTVANVAMGHTSNVLRCTPKYDHIKTAACIEIDPQAVKFEFDGKAYNGIANLPGFSWGKVCTSTVDKGVALLLRVLPVTPTYKNRSDCHLWPKGTFLEVGQEQTTMKPVILSQRRQQRHDLTEWKGLSKVVDVSNYILNARKPVTIQMTCHEESVYAYSLSVCQYRSWESLFVILTGDGERALEKLSRATCLESAIQVAQRQMVVLDSDNEDEAEENGTMVFSLTCPISKKIMLTPVRAQGCKHWQCFDLKAFLEYNVPVSGNRWRCGSCERFVSCNELQICGLTSDLLKEFEGAATTQRDRVELSSNGSYKLLIERKKRYTKREATEDGGNKRSKADDTVIVL
jgi:hypothetical protein